MGLFSRNKGQPAQTPPAAPAAPQALGSPGTAPSGAQSPSLSGPGSYPQQQTPQTPGHASYMVSPGPLGLAAQEPLLPGPGISYHQPTGTHYGTQYAGQNSLDPIARPGPFDALKGDPSQSLSPPNAAYAQQRQQQLAEHQHQLFLQQQQHKQHQLNSELQQQQNAQDYMRHQMYQQQLGAQQQQYQVMMGQAHSPPQQQQRPRVTFSNGGAPSQVHSYTQAQSPLGNTNANALLRQAAQEAAAAGRPLALNFIAQTHQPPSPYQPPQMHMQFQVPQGGAPGSALLRQAAQQAAAAGKPLAIDFIAHMQPDLAARPYGVGMPPPYGSPPLDPALLGAGGGGPPVFFPRDPAMGLPPGWQPGRGSDPYEHIRIPALPDMKALPPEMQDFRDQCATGVRQAVAMVTAMEHQLWWERSRRQQAEEDCKVLLAAVHAERGVGDALLGAEERRRAELAAAEGRLHLAADELPKANDAATTIQKHVRGRLARKEFEGHLRDILRGVDPLLDPQGLPAAAQSHISGVNTTGAPRRLGLRTLLGDPAPGQGPGRGMVPPEAAEAAAYYRRQADRIGQRLASHRDAGEPHPNDYSGDPLQADVKQLLTGTYPASSAQVIAALVRRCRELQAALLEAVGQLEEAQLSIQGLKEANAKLSELSTVRQDLELARHDNVRLAATVAKLRTVLTAQAVGANAEAARENPHVAAWYRKAYADREWQRVPPGGPGGTALLDGPDTAVETWDDLRASLPEPVLLPRVAQPGTGYKDLLALKQDMVMAAAQGPPDPLYSMPVPDRSSFVYERDTPLIPTQSPAPILRESLPTDAFVGVHDDLYRRTPRASPSAAGGLSYTPQVPTAATYTATAGGGSAGATPRDARGNLLPSSAIHAHPNIAPYGAPSYPYGEERGMGVYDNLVQQQRSLQKQLEFERLGALGGGGVGVPGSAPGSGGREGGGLSGGRQHDFDYNRDTPLVPMYSVLPYIREDDYVRRSSSPGRGAEQPGTPLAYQRPTTSPQSASGAAAAAAGGTYYPSPPPMPTNMPYIRDQVAHGSPQGLQGPAAGGGGSGAGEYSPQQQQQPGYHQQYGGLPYQQQHQGVASRGNSRPLTPRG